VQLSLALVTAFVNLVLVIFILAKNQRSSANRLFGALIFVNSLYPIFNYASLHSTDNVTAFFWAKLAILTGVLTGPLYFFFVRVFPEDRLNSRKLTVFLFTGWALLDGGLLFSNLIFKSVSIVKGQPSLAAGPAIPLFGLMMITTLFGGSWHLYRKYKVSSGLPRKQLQLVMIGLFGGLGMTFISTIILPIGFGNTVLIAPSPVFLLFTGITISYAILRRRLFNIGSVVARSVAYLLFLVTAAAAYGLAAFTLSADVFGRTTSPLVQEWINIVLAIVLALSFQPLRRFFEKVTDRVFYRERYDSQQVINNFSKILVSELDLNRILKRTLAELCDNLHIQFGQIIVFNSDRVYRIEHYGPLPKRLMVAPELRRLDKPMLVSDELSSGERKHILESHGVRVSLTLRTREDFVGYVLLGDKLSGDIYTSQDIRLLEIIAKELAVAIQNAKAYAEIQAFNLTLQARVDHATNRLRVANRHLKDLDRAKDEFISMASHQLRTPLTTVKGYLSMMLEGDVGKLKDNQKEFVQYAFDASERMVNLISDLLNVSRLSAGRFLIQTKPTDMVQMIEDEVRQLQNHAKQKGIGLVFQRPPEPLPPVEIDDNKTRQVVMNFIDNAIYYTQRGEVRVVLEQTGDHVRLEVRDTGIGVPEEAKRKLFSKFFRAENAQVVRPDGTGLGLYLAKRVVEDQDGTIIFNSVQGKGSTFGFELPFKPPSKVTKAVKHEEKHGHPAHK
jgi:signal transduction histidine kinase